MAKDKRKALRRPVRYTAWIALAPDQLIGCVLADVSDTGGRLHIENTDNNPETFTLWLASNGSARRKCKVVRREQRQIGVAFERIAFDPGQVPLAPNFGVEIISTETIGTDANESAGATDVTPKRA
jgi:hypothetical protein